MISKAVLKYVRMSPRKFRLIIPLVKGKNAEEALAILAFVKRGASAYCIDLINSAIANAKRVQGVDTAKLYISRLTADGGPMMKRFRAASMGRAGMIKKRTSHITLELDQAEAKSDAVSKVSEKAEKRPGQKAPAKLKSKPKSAATEIKHEHHSIKKTVKKG